MRAIDACMYNKHYRFEYSKILYFLWVIGSQEELVKYQNIANFSPIFISRGFELY